MTDDPGASGMPPKVRAWLDYELAYAAYWAGRTTTEPERYIEGPSVDELCAALPHAGDQLERVKILGALRSELYNGEDLIIGELYLAAQEFPERMDHMYDYMGAASSARKELGPDVVEWLRCLEESPEGIDMETAAVMVRALHMEEDWADLIADWGEMVPAHLVERTVWHDGNWRHRGHELVLLHQAEADAVRSRQATPEQLAEWKTDWRTWPRPVKTDQAGPWVVREVWAEFLRLKGLDDAELEAEHQAAQMRAELTAEHREWLQRRLDKLEAEAKAAEQAARAISTEYQARVEAQMRQMTPVEVESAIELNDRTRRRS